MTIDQVRSATAALWGLPEAITNALKQMHTDIEKWQASTAFSASWKADKAQSIRDATGATIDGHERQMQDAFNTINSYEPTFPGADSEVVREQQVARGWGRAQAMLDGGMSPKQVLQQAVSDRDAPMLQALHEEMPARLMGGRGTPRDRQLAAEEFRALTEKGIALAFPDSEISQYWFTIQDAQLAAQVAAAAIQSARADVADTAVSVFDAAATDVRSKTLAMLTDLRLRDLADLKAKTQTLNPPTLALML